MELDIAIFLFGLMVSSCVVAIISLKVFALGGQRYSGFMDNMDQEISYLFEDDQLIDATGKARELLAAAPAGDLDLARLSTHLETRFPGLVTALEELPESRLSKIQSIDENSALTVEWLNGVLRLTVRDNAEETDYVRIDKHSYKAMEQELEMQRSSAKIAPFLVWSENSDGSISWANNAYIEISQQFQAKLSVKAWPLNRIFSKGANTNSQNPLRLSAQLPNEAEPSWFECTQTSFGDGNLFIAIPIDNTVKAEQALRDFTQTLTKTFAHLKIGLAIFDKQRQLAIFNPALTDLTGLPIDFLLQKPTLHTFLNQLREKRMIPEQRDYVSWRQRLFELEIAAENGTYEETWSLSSGQTYRVTGHPHPDGALAFLIEDISAELSLTRQFRREMETGQAVIDSLDEAIAVFSPSGDLTFSNFAYSNLWGANSCDTIGGTDIVEATRHWGKKCAPSPVWGDAREFVSLIGERTEWNANVRLTDGRLLSCRFAPLVGGSTLAGFNIDQLAVQKLSKNQFSTSALVLENMSG